MSETGRQKGKQERPSNLVATLCFLVVLLLASGLGDLAVYAWRKGEPGRAMLIAVYILFAIWLPVGTIWRWFTAPGTPEG